MGWCIVSDNIYHLVGVIVGCLTILTTLGKWFIVAPLKRYIDVMTHPIQPNANGGKSLPDVASKLAAIETKIDSLQGHLITVDKRVDRHIEQHIGKGE